MVKTKIMMFCLLSYCVCLVLFLSSFEGVGITGLLRMIETMDLNVFLLFLLLGGVFSLVLSSALREQIIFHHMIKRQHYVAHTNNLDWTTVR